MDHMDYEPVVADIMATGAEVVFNTIVPPGLTPFLDELHDAGFTARGGSIVCTYFDENFLNLVPAEQVEGLYGCLDYYREVDDPFSIELLNRYEGLFPGSALFTAGSACTGTYRALKFWEAAVIEAGSLDQDDIIAALDHARIEQGPGGPAEMVPGQHHVRMNMYIARSEGGTFNGGREPRPHRPRRVRGGAGLTLAVPDVRCMTSGTASARVVPSAPERKEHHMDPAGQRFDYSAPCAARGRGLPRRRRRSPRVSNCAPWTVRRLASHALEQPAVLGGHRHRRGDRDHSRTPWAPSPTTATSRAVRRGGGRNGAWRCGGPTGC